MTIAIVLCLSLLAGYGVNRLADTMPPDTAAHKSRHRLPSHRLRTGGVYLSALAIGGLAHTQGGSTPQPMLGALEA
ncbi:MAG: hypothetical protein KDE19_22010, partial [Caldilineaceae bacterium]|nr:hypothetical protein [Caldilineaceae bacterium]